jgi:hypothetical protein
MVGFGLLNPNQYQKPRIIRFQLGRPAPTMTFMMELETRLESLDARTESS